jgi:hypothetical protein
MAYAFKSFGYAIDYDKEIADDLANLALVDSAEQRAISAETTEPWPWDMTAWLLADGEAGYLRRAAIFGLSDGDRVCLLQYLLDNLADARLPWALPYLEERVRDLYTRGGRLLTRLEQYQVITEKHRKQLVAKLKTTLARHRRNKARFGS